MMKGRQAQPSYRNPRVRRWASYLWREAIRERWRAIQPAAARPTPEQWSSEEITVSWLGHATILINFFGVRILTDPVLHSYVGIRIPPLFTLGPKRLTAPALRLRELPRIDLILLSHAHFDHFDWPTLRFFPRSTKVVTASNTRDLLSWTRLRDVTEVRWRERVRLTTASGSVDVVGCEVKHWGARVQKDVHRGYNAYLLERNGHRILFGGDTANTDAFRALRHFGPIDIAAMSVGCYNPWIHSHATPEEAIRMANDADAQFVVPIHHQTFRLSFEPFREPIERFETALTKTPERVALREIGETFRLPR
jgi:L-ascorbate metabolism protein UlaG (beta-lactamase superfamily)